MSEEWFSMDAVGEDGSPDAVAAIFETVVETLRHAPEGKRYDFEIVVEERDDQ